MHITHIPVNEDSVETFCGTYQTERAVGESTAQCSTCYLKNVALEEGFDINEPIRTAYKNLENDPPT